MSERKTEFWWASIHDADPEPVEKTEHEGRPCVYTLGCADPFYLDEVPCAVMFLPQAPYSNAHLPMVRPKHTAILAAERAAREEELLSNIRRGHGWRGPR